MLSRSVMGLVQESRVTFLRHPSTPQLRLRTGSARRYWVAVAAITDWSKSERKVWKSSGPIMR